MPLPEHVARSPESVGVDPEKVAALLRSRRARRARRVPRRRSPSREGKIAAMRSFGAVTRRATAPATDQTLYVIFSAPRRSLAAAWLLLDEGKLRLDEPVAAVIPEFASNGKDAVTLEQLLTHTAGFPQAPLDPRKVGWSQLAERFATWRLNWEPGSRFEYHASSSMWVVAAMVQARSGRDFCEFVRARIAEPLGLPDLRVGCPRAEQGGSRTPQSVEA
jgi:CubicO group peptidase (beta-lactamase class C family)